MIKEAAILFNGQIYTGKRHHEIIANIIKTTGIKRVGANNTQGFITDTGEFVDRKQAAIIAIKCGQIAQLKYSSQELFSEDLY